MTKEEIIFTLAKQCGWKLRDGHKYLDLKWEDPDGNPCFETQLPDYLNDLNEVRKAELAIWRDECIVEKYEEILKDMYLKAVGY